MNNEKTKAIIRGIVTILLFINSWIIARGGDGMPFDEVSLTEAVTAVVTLGAIAWSWWKDAPITKAGIESHAIMKGIKADGMAGEDDVTER